MPAEPQPIATNDNAEPMADAISFSDLCIAMGEDEDGVLRRLAAILRPPIKEERENG